MDPKSDWVLTGTIHIILMDGKARFCNGEILSYSFNEKVLGGDYTEYEWDDELNKQIQDSVDAHSKKTYIRDMKWIGRRDPFVGNLLDRYGFCVYNLKLVIQSWKLQMNI